MPAEALQNARILIVGAGIAGLALARRLAAAGFDFRIVEKREGPEQGGSGIALPFNAQAALVEFGLRDAVVEAGYQVKQVTYAKPGGQVLGQASLLEAPLNAQPFVAVRRARLHEILSSGIEDRIVYGARVTKVAQESDGVVVECSHAAYSGRYDLVIAADGLESQVRNQCYPDSPCVVDHGISNWRFIIQRPSHGREPIYYFGRTEMFMLYPCGPHEIYCYAHMHDNEIGAAKNEAPEAALPRIFADYAAPVRDACEGLGPGDIITSRLRSVREPFFYRGRVAFIGDAANGCSPLLQQGAAAALEDVLSLVSALQTQGSIDAALKHYRNKREAKIRWIVDKSDGPIAKVGAMRSLPVRLIRNMIIRAKGPLNVAGWRFLANYNDGLEAAERRV